MKYDSKKIIMLFLILAILGVGIYLTVKIIKSSSIKKPVQMNRQVPTPTPATQPAIGSDAVNNLLALLSTGNK
jgi:hypothetical protein